MSSRMIAGQIDINTIEPFRDRLSKYLSSGSYSDMRDRVEIYLKEIKRILFPKLDINAHHGKENQTIESDHMYEMYKVMRYEIENNKKNNSWNVYQDMPLKLTDKPLIKVIPLTDDIIRDENIDNLLNN